MSTITIDFPDIRESDSAAYAYLANVYDSTCAHNQAAWRSPYGFLRLLVQPWWDAVTHEALKGIGYIK